MPRPKIVHRYMLHKSSAAADATEFVKHVVGAGVGGETGHNLYLADLFQDNNEPVAPIIRRIGEGHATEITPENRYTLPSEWDAARTYKYDISTVASAPSHLPMISPDLPNGSQSGVGLHVSYLNHPTGHYWQVAFRTPGERREFLVPTHPEEVQQVARQLMASPNRGDQEEGHSILRVSQFPPGHEENEYVPPPPEEPHQMSRFLSRGAVRRYAMNSWVNLRQQLEQNPQHRWGGPNADHTLRGVAADAYEEHSGDTEGANLLRDPNQHVVIRDDQVLPGRFDPDVLDQAYRDALHVVMQGTKRTARVRYGEMSHIDPDSVQGINTPGHPDHGMVTLHERGLPYVNPAFDNSTDLDLAVDEPNAPYRDPASSGIHISQAAQLLSRDLETAWKKYPRRMKTTDNESRVQNALANLRTAHETVGRPVPETTSVQETPPPPPEAPPSPPPPAPPPAPKGPPKPITLADLMRPRKKSRFEVRRYSLASHEDFHRAIMENPTEDINHLAYADWLQEQGHEGVADLIRQAVKSGQRWLDSGLAVEKPISGDEPWPVPPLSGRQLYVWSKTPTEKHRVIAYNPRPQPPRLGEISEDTNTGLSQMSRRAVRRYSAIPTGPESASLPDMVNSDMPPEILRDAIQDQHGDAELNMVERDPYKSYGKDDAHEEPGSPYYHMTMPPIRALALGLHNHPDFIRALLPRLNYMGHDPRWYHQGRTVDYTSLNTPPEQANYAPRSQFHQGGVPPFVLPIEGGHLIIGQHRHAVNPPDMTSLGIVYRDNRGRMELLGTEWPYMIRRAAAGLPEDDAHALTTYLDTHYAARERMTRRVLVKRYAGETTEEHFQQMLDANPDDHQTRMILADFLEERGDPRAAGYRALGHLKVSPRMTYGPGWTTTNNPTILYNHPSDQALEYPNHAVPRDWWERLSSKKLSGAWWKKHKSRRHADDDAALAFSKLPPERQQEIMSGTQPEKLSRMGVRRYTKKNTDRWAEAYSEEPGSDLELLLKQHKKNPDDVTLQGATLDKIMDDHGVTRTKARALRRKWLKRYAAYYDPRRNDPPEPDLDEEYDNPTHNPDVCPNCGREGSPTLYPPESDGTVMAECPRCGHFDEHHYWEGEDEEPQQMSRSLVKKYGPPFRPHYAPKPEPEEEPEHRMRCFNCQQAFPSGDFEEDPEQDGVMCPGCGWTGWPEHVHDDEEEDGYTNNPFYTPPPDEPEQYDAYRSPAGGMVVRGTHYKGGEMVPDMTGPFANPVKMAEGEDTPPDGFGGTGPEVVHTPVDPASGRAAVRRRVKMGRDQVARYAGETTEEDFQRMLDQNPDDHATRMILADFLEELGDPRAAGYRAMGQLNVRPYKTIHRNDDKAPWLFGSDENPDPEHNHAPYPNIELPHNWLDRVPSTHGVYGTNPNPAIRFWTYHKSRRDAEDTAARAFAGLPPEEQQEILSRGPDITVGHLRGDYLGQPTPLEGAHSRNNIIPSRHLSRRLLRQPKIAVANGSPKQYTTSRRPLLRGRVMHATAPTRYSTANDHKTFMNALQKNENDLTTRKVFADWLEENAPETTTPGVLKTLRGFEGRLWVGMSPKGKVNAIPRVSKALLEQYPNLEAYHSTSTNRQGRAHRVRTSGRMKTWKTRPDEFRVPWKHGLYENGEFTHRNVHEWLMDDPTAEPNPNDHWAPEEPTPPTTPPEAPIQESRKVAVRRYSADQSTIHNLMAQLQSPEQNEHRWGFDNPIGGLRGVLADAMDENGRSEEANILREPNRHVVVQDGRVVPGVRVFNYEYDFPYVRGLKYPWTNGHDSFGEMPGTRNPSDFNDNDHLDAWGGEITEVPDPRHPMNGAYGSVMKQVDRHLYDTLMNLDDRVEQNLDINPRVEQP